MCGVRDYTLNALIEWGGASLRMSVFCKRMESGIHTLTMMPVFPEGTDERLTNGLPSPLCVCIPAGSDTRQEVTPISCLVVVVCR